MAYLYNSFPEQCISLKSKTRKWRMRHLDWATNLSNSHAEAIRQTTRHKMINNDLTLGKIHMDDLQLILNPDGIEAGYIPDKIQHYPIINSKLNILLGEERRRPFNYHAVVTNPEAVSEIEKTKKNLIFQELQQLIQDTSMDENDYNQKLQELDRYYKYEFQDQRELWANEVIKHYSKEQNFRQMFNYGFFDGLKFGEESYLCDIVDGEPVIEKINPFEMQTYMSGYSNRIEDADVVVITQYWSPGKIFDYFFSDKDFKKVAKRLYDYKEGDEADHFGVTNMDEHDPAQFYLNMDFITGDGMFTNGFEFDPFAQYGESMVPTEPYDQFGNIRVVRMFWKSRKKIKIVTKFDGQTNQVVKELYTDDYITNYDAGETEDVVWINEAWEGTKIGRDIYVQMGPRPNQYRRMSNPSQCNFGIIGQLYSFDGMKPYSLVDMMKPYNYLYDVLKDRLNKAIANDWGTMLKLDLSLKPKSWDIEQWMYYAKVNHLMVVDSFNEGNKGAATGKLAGGLNNNTQALVSANTGNYIQQLMNLLEYVKNEMAEVVGITKQREGQISNRETVGGVERATLQSSHITEWLFSIHEDVKRRVLECFIETAKTASNGENLKFRYITSDLAQKTIDIDGKEFCECDYGIVIDDSEDVQEQLQKLDMLVQAGLQNQMINFSTAMKIFQTCSLSEKIRMIEINEQEMRQRAEQAQQQQQQIAQQQMQMQAETEQMKMQQQDLLNERDNETRLAVANIQAQNKVDLKYMEDDDFQRQSSQEELIEKMRQFDEQMKLENEKLQHLIDDDKEKNDIQRKKIQSDERIKKEQIRKQNQNKNK